MTLVSGVIDLVVGKVGIQENLGSCVVELLLGNVDIANNSLTILNCEDCNVVMGL